MIKPKLFTLPHSRVERSFPSDGWKFGAKMKHKPVSPFILITIICFSSAMALYGPNPPLLIMGNGLMGSEQLYSFFMENNPDADEQRVVRLAVLYIAECAFEGVNSDVAFVQMCLETGFLRFQGLVTAEMNNFCGLGAVGPGQPGHSFPDECTGIRAHVQHLKAYGSSDPLNGDLVDPRYHYVTPRGKSPDIQGLAGTWAADRLYGDKLIDLLERLYQSY